MGPFGRIDAINKLKEQEVKSVDGTSLICDLGLHHCKYLSEWDPQLELQPWQLRRTGGGLMQTRKQTTSARSRSNTNEP